MFGYLRPRQSELRLREYGFYRACYCGLCKRMGKCTGQCSRLTLNYDFVFLAAVRISLCGDPVTVRRGRCLLHPFRGRDLLVGSAQSDVCADVSALLTYHKCRDDLADERGWKKFRAALARPFLAGARKRSARRHPELDRVISAKLAALREWEASDDGIPSADRPAKLFGELMSAVFSEGLTGTDARIAASVGGAIGQWIYLFDAADDFDEDLRRNRYNPYVRLFGKTPDRADWETVRCALTAYLSEAERAVALIDHYPRPELKEILSNILFLGLPDAQDRVLNERAAPSGTDDAPSPDRHHDTKETRGTL